MNIPFSYADVLVLVALILPYLALGFAKAHARKSFDNADPRNADAYQGVAKRAQGAHLNGLENFPFFAIAVIFAEFRGADQLYVNLLAAIYIFIRILYNISYIQDKPSQRSVLWGLGFLANIALFLSPLLLLLSK